MDEFSTVKKSPADEYAYRQYRALKIGVLATLVLACALPLAMNVVDPDLWGHWQYGRDWLAEGRLPRTASHTYVDPTHRWINHENSAELALAIGYDVLGVYGLLIAKCLLGLAILAAMAAIAVRRGVHLLAVWTLLTLVAANLQAFFPLRPQLLSFLLFSCALVCLDRAFPNWTSDDRIRFRWLWALPPLFAAWVNSHGAFVAGLGVVGALLAGRMIELFVRQGFHSGAKQLHLAAVGLAIVAATLLNPYGLELHRWLLSSLGSPRPEITEWAPPSPDQPVFWPFVTLAIVATASLLLARKRRDWPQVAILVLVAWQASVHLRHIAFFSLLCGFWLPVYFQSALARLLPDRKRELPAMLPSLWIRVSMAGVILAAVGLQSFALAQRLSDLPVYRDRYPVDALQKMVDHRLNGKLVVSFNWAQYAIAALAPDVKVGFDGRFRTCYSQNVVDMHFDFLLGEHDGKRFRSLESGPIDGRKVLEAGHPDLVLVDRNFANAVRIMEEEAGQDLPEWSLLYRDPLAEIWGRTERFDDPSSPHYFPLDERALEVRLLQARFQWPALPDRSLWDGASQDDHADVTLREHSPSQKRNDDVAEDDRYAA